MKRQVLDCLTYGALLALLSLIFINCADPKADGELASNHQYDATPTPSPTPSPTPRYLYVASGGCYAGGANPVLLGSATVSKYDLTTGQFEGTVIDYNTASPGDQPVSIVDYDQDHFLVLVENTGGRRVDLIRKDGQSYYTYLTNSAALGSASGIVRNMILLPDYSLLISRSTAIEKFSSSRARVLVGPGPGAPTLSFIASPGGTCATSTTLIPTMTALSNGKVVYAHALAAQNRIGVISSSGYVAAANCLGAQISPDLAAAFPTSMIYHSTKKLLVAYGGTTLSSNYIYSYDIDENTNAISNITKAYENLAVVNGPSAIVEDPLTSEVYVASGINSFNTVEKFTYDPTSRTLSRVGTRPYLNYSIYTRCVSGMMVSN